MVHEPTMRLGCVDEAPYCTIAFSKQSACPISASSPVTFLQTNPVFPCPVDPGVPEAAATEQAHSDESASKIPTAIMSLSSFAEQAK